MECKCFRPPQYPHTIYRDNLTRVECKCKKEDRAGKGIHFFIHDYQFIRLWNTPDKYIDLLKDFDYVLTPDFSTYTDMPKALQIYNIYRKQWLGAYWQMQDINVIMISMPRVGSSSIILADAGYQCNPNRKLEYSGQSRVDIRRNTKKQRCGDFFSGMYEREAEQGAVF